MPDISKNVLGVLIATPIVAVLGFAVVALHDDYVIELVMPPMVKESSPYGTAPLLVELDQRYQRVGEAVAVEERANPMQPAIEEIREELLNLRDDVSALRLLSPAPAPILQPVATIEQVRLYLSMVEGEEHLIVLNGNSPSLSRDIRYGGRYALSLAGTAVDPTEAPLRAELRNLHAPGLPEHAAIGRIPERHFDRLSGRSRGFVVADVHLVDAPPETR